MWAEGEAPYEALELAPVIDDFTEPVVVEDPVLDLVEDAAVVVLLVEVVVAAEEAEVVVVGAAEDVVLVVVGAAELDACTASFAPDPALALESPASNKTIVAEPPFGTVATQKFAPPAPVD